ncbi:MATE family efflux transporter [Zongyangia hominis]|uniref:Probable multidrug resistance protein NorM n=1 Tax=Zongyangia hominis TaxID=2763677 RepID=A0A926E9J3_9FIRM|nr:MATE family efflux transporter [Zongyangia hominis]MBC8569827.1 MATE family efflux transporter [Zongyangia hominis]
MFSNRDLRKLIIPLMIEQILAVTIGMADTVMVASVGEAAVSGISLVDSINILLINVFSALATGGAVVTSQYLGRRDEKNARTAGKQLIYTVGALSIVIMILCLAAHTPILRMAFGHIDSDVMNNAQTYFFLSALSYPFIAIYNAGAALFRSMGNSRVSMFASLIMNVVNISGNAILIFQFHMGVAGAGIASLVSRILACLFIMILLHRPLLPIHVEELWRFDLKPKMIKNILQIGVPNGLENGMFQIGKILVQSLIATFGTAAIAANAVASTVANVAILPGAAIGLAMITVVGQCVGAGDYDQAQKYTVKLTKLAYLCMAVLNLACLLLTPFLVGFFHLSDEATRSGIQILMYHSLCAIFLWTASFTLPNGLRAAGDVKYTMTMSIISMWVFRIAFSYLLADFFHMGVLGVWIAMTIDWAFRVIVFVGRFVRGKWKNIKMLQN